MDGSAAIERNREALRRIVVMLVGMAELAGTHDTGARTLPRHLWLVILRLLRPAEAAARRLIIAAARGLVVKPPPARKHQPRPVNMEPILRSLGLAVMMPPGAATAILPRKAGEGDHAKRGGGGGLESRAPRLPSIPLFDPLRHPFRQRRRYVPAHAAPRIMFPGIVEPHRLPPPPSPDDPIDAARLGQRLTVLLAALDDLPGQAMRFARWKARRDAEGAPRMKPAAGRFRRVSPLRQGRPPGGRFCRFDPGARRRANIREVDEILAHAHALAIYALDPPDTS